MSDTSAREAFEKWAIDNQEAHVQQPLDGLKLNLAWRAWCAALAWSAKDFAYEMGNRPQTPHAAGGELREALRFVLTHHQLEGTDLVGWFGTCSCGGQGRLPVDFETQEEYVEHILSNLPLALAAQTSPAAGEGRDR
jgi:hypothetical protein